MLPAGIDELQHGIVDLVDKQMRGSDAPPTGNYGLECAICRVFHSGCLEHEMKQGSPFHSPYRTRLSRCSPTSPEYKTTSLHKSLPFFFFHKPKLCHSRLSTDLSRPCMYYDIFFTLILQKLNLLKTFRETQDPFQPFWSFGCLGIPISPLVS
jgi:hypothetical protein